MMSVIGFANGINAVCETSWLTPMKVRELSLTCTKAFIKLDLMQQEVGIFRSSVRNLDEINLWKTKHEIKK